MDEEESSVSVRLNHVEKRIEILEGEGKEKNKALVEIEKANIREENNGEKTLMIVTSLSDKLEDVANEVNIIKTKSGINWDKWKWVLITFILSNVVGIISIIVKALKTP